MISILKSCNCSKIQFTIALLFFVWQKLIHRPLLLAVIWRHVRNVSRRELHDYCREGGFTVYGWTACWKFKEVFLLSQNTQTLCLLVDIQRSVLKN